MNREGERDEQKEKEMNREGEGERCKEGEEREGQRQRLEEMQTDRLKDRGERKTEILIDCFW